MSTYTQELAKRIREQNEIRGIYKERQKEAQTSYDTAVNTLKSGGDVYSLDDSARAMYRNIQTELAKQQRKEQERLKKEREQMSGIERFGHTLGDFFGQGVGGLMKFGENFVDYFGTMFGADEEWLKRDWTQELYMDKLREGTKGSYLNDGKFGNMVQSSMFGLGNMLPSLALNAVPYVGGALSTSSFMVNAAGGSTENALQNGATRDKALLYGTLSGVAEGAIEKISGGIGGVGKGIVQSVGKSAGKSAVAKGVLGTAKKYTGRMIGEGLEEVASDVLDPLLRATYTGKVDYSDVSAGSLAETFGVGAMTSGLMLGGQAMAHNATAANRVRTKLGELNEVKAALDKRYYDGKLTEAQYKQGLSDINWLAEKTIKTMNRVSDRKAEKIVDKVGEKRLENAGIIQSNGGFSVNNANAGAYNYKAMTPSLANKVDKLAYQPTSAELTAEQESLVKDYGKINNGKASIVFTDDIGAVTEDGSRLSANGAYSDGVIYISRTAENPLREVMKHEFTHALEGTKAYGKFASFVIDEIQKSPVLQKEYGDFAKTFIETAEQYQGVTADDRAIVSEIVAKYSERLFSDPKAINRLARANKGLAMKVLGMVTDRLSALGKGKETAEMRKFLRRAEGLYRKAIIAKPSRGIALNGNTANEKDTTADINENSNTVNTAKTSDSTEYRSKIETNSQNIDENSNITDGNIKKVISKNGQIVQYDIQKSYSEQIDDALNGELNQNQFIYIGKPSSIMLENGFANYDIVMSNNVLKKLQEKHGLSISTIKELNTAINNPIYILESNTVENAKVIVTDLKDAESRPIIVAIHLDVNTKIGIVNILASAYGRNSFANFLNRARSEEKILYENKEKAQVYLQGATIAQSDITRASDNSISNSKTNVNNSATESLKNQENNANIDENSNIADGKPKIQYAIKNVDKTKINFEENENTVREMKPVTSIKSNVFQKGNTKLTDMVAQYFNSLGNNVFNAELGDVELNKRGVKDSMAHGIGALKAAAFKAVPRVIEKGKIVDYQDNWKNRGEDTVVLSAPILIDKTQYYMGVILLRDNSHDLQRFYLHEISLNKKEVNPFKTVAAAGRTNSLHGGLTSNNSISNSDTNVNNSATESLKSQENNINIDENSNNDIKYSLKINKAQLSENITLTAEQIESVDKALKAIENEDMARSHIANAIKSLRIDIDGKTYRVVYNDKYYDVSIDMLTKALEGIKNNSLVDLNTLAKHIINAVELYDESAYKLLKGYSKTELNKISKILSHAKRNKIRLSGSLITANDTQIVNEYCSIDGAVTLTSLVNQLKEMGVAIKGRTLIKKLQNLDKLYKTVSNSKNGLKLADIAPKKVSLQQRVIANRIIKSIDKTGAMTAIIDSLKNVEKAKAKAVEENAKADAKIAKAKEIEKQSYEREKMEAPIIQIKDICARFKEYAERNYRTGSILAMPDMDGIIKAFNKITWVRGLRSNKSIHEALTLLQSFIKANRNAEDIVLGFSSEIVDKIDELVELTRLKPYDAKPDKIQTKREVDDLLKVVKAVDYLFKHHHAIVLDGEVIDVAESTETAIKELDYACNFNKGINAISMKESSITSDPRTIYTMVSGAFDDNNVIMRLYDDLLKSETEAKLTAIELLEPVEQFFKDNKQYKKDIYNKKITVHGVSLELGQAIMIYMQSKQVGVIDRLTITGAYGTDSRGKTVDIKSITASDIEYIEKQLSKADFELIKLFEDTFSRAGHVKYEADNNLNGYSDITPGKYYVPLVVEGANLVKSYTSATQWVDEFNERNYGFNQHRNRMATKQLKLVNVFDEVYRHCQDLGVYAKLTQAFRNFDQLMNYNINLGNPKSREVITLKSHIKKNVWSGFDKYQLDFFADIRGDKRQNQSAVIQWLRNNWIVAKLGLNIKSWVSQFSGLAMGVIHLDFKHLAKGTVTPMSKERFLEYGGYAKVRVHERAAMRAKGFEGKLGRINSWTTKPIQMADNLMMRQFMSGCESQIEEQLGHKVSTREEMDLVCDLFETTVRETQSGDMISEKSALQRHSSDVLRTLATFKSDAIKMISNIKKNIYRIIAAKKFLKANPNSERGKIALKEAKKRLRRSVTGMTVSNAIYVGIALLFNLLLRKRDEEGKKWDAEDYGKAFGMGMLESFVGMYPLIGDIFNKATSGYDIEQFSYSMINDLVDGSVGVFKLVENAIKGEEVTKTDGMKALRNVFYAVSEFFGVPSKNMIKYSKMIVGWFDEGAIYKHNSLFYPAKKSELNAAIEEKNDGLSESIFGVMLTERGFGDMSETAQKKLLELYKAVYKDGVSVMPSNVPNKVSWKDSNGAEQEKDLKAADKAVYRANNAKAAKDIEKLLKSGEFSSLSKKEQADAVKKIYAYYNALSKVKVTEKEEINTQMLLASLLSVEDMAILSVKNASLVADEYANGKIIPDSKKRKLLKLLNTFGLTFAEKELVRVILGYSPSNPKTIKQTIRRSSLTSDEKAYLIRKVA